MKFLSAVSVFAFGSAAAVAQDDGGDDDTNYFLRARPNAMVPPSDTKMLIDEGMFGPRGVGGVGGDRKIRGGGGEDDPLSNVGRRLTPISDGGQTLEEGDPALFPPDFELPTGEVDNITFEPGPPFDPLSDEEVQELSDLLPADTPLKGLQIKPGKGKGRGNINALKNSGKPFLLNGLDDDTKHEIMDELGIGLDDMNQPYLMVVPHKGQKGERYFHFIEAPAPVLSDTYTKKDFTAKFLFGADSSVREQNMKDKNSDNEENGNGRGPNHRHLAATASREYVVSIITTDFGPTIDLWFMDPIFVKLAECWFTYRVKVYDTSAGKDVVITSKGNWNSMYTSDDRNGSRGWANGHMTQKINIPNGYSLHDYFPKNKNNVHTVTESKSFELSGTVGTDTGIGSSYSQEESVSYTLTDWEILANGPNQWDFKQQRPFRVYEDPMYRSGSCWFEGGCLHRPPALSRGNFHFETVSHVRGVAGGKQYFSWTQTGRSFIYRDDGWFDSSWSWYTFHKYSGFYFEI